MILRLPIYIANILAYGYRGKIEEQTAYLPSGIPYPLFDRTPVTDRRHIGNIWQSFNGYYTYDNTARSHYPLIPSFDTLDPQAEKYPSLSPYSHCAGNPRNVVDPSGENPIYDLNGEFQGCTKEGFTGVILIKTSNGGYMSYEVFSADENSKDYVGNICIVAPYNDMSKAMSGEASSKIFTDILSKYEGVEIIDTKFSMSSIAGQKVHYKESDTATWTTEYTESGSYIKLSGNGNTDSYEPTVENYAASLLFHEWYSHGVKHVSDEKNNHSEAYLNTMKSYPLLKTTSKYKQFIKTQYKSYLMKEYENKQNKVQSK